MFYFRHLTALIHRNPLKQTIKENIVGHRITEVSYLELNHPEQPLFFDGFDCFDLGIEIEFSNGFKWHIGWKDNDRPEIGTGEYHSEKYYSGYKKVNATTRWSSFTDKVIKDFELIYVCKEWNLPAQCIIHFDNSESIPIIIGEELNLDGSIPIPIKYASCSEFYVFHSMSLPKTELIQITPPSPSTFKELTPVIKNTKNITQGIIGFLILLAILMIIIWKTLSDY